MPTQTIPGARAVVLAQGQKIGFTNTLSYTITQGLTRIDVMDQLQSAELAETSYEVSCQMGTFRRFGSSATQQGIQSRVEDLLNQPELTFEIHDRQNPGSPALLIERLKMEQNSGSVDARGVWQETWNFQGIKASFEGGA